MTKPLNSIQIIGNLIMEKESIVWSMVTSLDQLKIFKKLLYLIMGQHYLNC